MTSADVTSMMATQTSTASGTKQASTTCGRYRPKYAASGSIPETLATATSAASTPSSPPGTQQPLLRECQPELREDRRSRTPPGYLERPGEKRPPREHTQERDELGLDLVEGCAVEGAGDDPCKERRLRENEDRRGSADRDVYAEEHANRTCAANEALVERAH